MPNSSELAPAITDLAWDLERRWYVSPRIVSELVGRINSTVEASHECYPHKLFGHLRLFLYLIRTLHTDIQTGMRMFTPDLPQEEREKASNLLNELEDKLISTVIGNLSSVCACEWRKPQP